MSEPIDVVAEAIINVRKREKIFLASDTHLDSVILADEVERLQTEKLAYYEKLDATIGENYHLCEQVERLQAREAKSSKLIDDLLNALQCGECRPGKHHAGSYANLHTRVRQYHSADKDSITATEFVTACTDDGVTRIRFGWVGENNNE